MYSGGAFGPVNAQKQSFTAPNTRDHSLKCVCYSLLCDTTKPDTVGRRAPKAPCTRNPEPCFHLLTVDPIIICQTFPRTQSGTPLRTLLRSRLAFRPLCQSSKLSIIVRHLSDRFHSFRRLALAICKRVAARRQTVETCAGDADLGLA